VFDFEHNDGDAMGRIGKLVTDLLRFQAPVIDDGLALLTFLALLVLFVGLVVFAVLWPLWHFVARPIAAAYGLVPPTGYDYLVRAWKAERRGQWAEALRAYDEALSLNRSDPEVLSRREKLLQDHPDLRSR
jgi:hypothetical protein